MDLTQETDIGSAHHTWTIPRKRGASTVLLTDGQHRVLLVEPTYKAVWEAPGGAIEDNESPRTAVAREVKEELGLVVDVGRLIAIDWAPPMDGRTESVVYVYDAAPLVPEQTSAITLAEDELRSWAWSTPAQVRKRMRPLVARRIEAALTAIQTNRTVELENGYAVGTATT